jgi:hypothetical protein
LGKRGEDYKIIKITLNNIVNIRGRDAFSLGLHFPIQQGLEKLDDCLAMGRWISQRNKLLLAEKNWQHEGTDGHEDTDHRRKKNCYCWQLLEPKQSN